MSTPAIAKPVERKYAMTKIAPGDYLLPSNDGRTLWRISRYVDGPSGGLDLPRDREFWGVWRWHKEMFPGAYIDAASWERWDFHDGSYATRGEAVQATLAAVGF